jgi:hypothetical protein
MGMTTRVYGLVSPDNELYQKHAKVLIACLEAGVKLLPVETAKYFDGESPEEYLLIEKLKINIPHEEITEDMDEIYVIDISKLPEGVTKIRVVNSY